MDNYRYKSKKYQTKFSNLQTKYNMEQAIDKIKKSNMISFQFVDITLSRKEKQAINTIEVIKRPRVFDYYGVVSNPELIDKIAAFINKLSNDNKSRLIANILVNRIIKSFVEAMGADSIWFTIRALSEANSNYDIPRWHYDGPFYDSDLDYQLKLAGVLKGPATLFKENTHEMRNTFTPLFLENI